MELWLPRLRPAPGGDSICLDLCLNLNPDRRPPCSSLPLPLLLPRSLAQGAGGPSSPAASEPGAQPPTCAVPAAAEPGPGGSRTESGDREPRPERARAAAAESAPGGHGGKGGGGARAGRRAGPGSERGAGSTGLIAAAPGARRMPAAPTPPGQLWRLAPGPT